MSWQDDRANSYHIADIFNIKHNSIDEAHYAYNHTWHEILQRLMDQFEQYNAYMNDDPIPEFPYDPDDWPDWAGYYHGRGE